MATKRNRHEKGLGATSQAFRLTKYSLLCLRPPSMQPNGKNTSYEYLTDYERRNGLTRKNIRTMIERRMLVILKFRHRYYVAPIEECIDDIKEYIHYERKNHPLKKGKGREYTSREELTAYRKQHSN